MGRPRINKITIKVKGIELTQTQKEIYAQATEDSCKFLTCNISRRQGKTTVCELLAMQWTFQDSLTIGYMTPTFRLGKRIFDSITRRLPENIIKSIDRTNLTMTTVNDTTLAFFSAEAPENCRGWGFSYMVLDESQFYAEEVKGQNVWQEILRPALREAKKVILISTPCTTDGFFFDCYNKGKEGKPGYKTIEKNIYDDGLITNAELETLKKELHPRFFAREFLVQFNNTDGALFDTNNMPATTTPASLKWGGCDFSTSGEDETVYTILDANGNVTQHVIKGDLQEKYRQIATLIREHKINITYAESNSIGQPMIDAIKVLLMGTPYRLTPFNTSMQSKKEYVELLMDAVQQQSIRTEDSALKSQLNTFEAKITPSRNITYAGRQGYHDDRVISLALAYKNKYDNGRRVFTFTTT